MKVLQVELEGEFDKGDEEMNKDRQDIEQMKESLTKLREANNELVNKIQHRDTQISQLSVDINQKNDELK